MTKHKDCDHDHDHKSCCGDDFLTSGLTRRNTLDLLAAGGLATFMSSIIPSIAQAQQPADEVVRIGYIPITDATALLVAHGMGFFKEQGLEAEQPTLIRGWSPLIESFAAGKFNLVHFLKPVPVWMRYNNKFPVKVVAWGHTNGSGLVVGGHTGVKTWAELAGKQVAVPYWYSMHNIVLQYALRESGLTPVIKNQTDGLGPKEVNLQIMAPPDMPTALAAKKIDAYIVAEPFNAMGELKAGATMLRFTGDIWKNHPCCVICMNESDTSGRKEWTQKVVNAVVQGCIYASENKKEVARMLSKDGKGYLPMPAEVIERSMLLYDEKTYGASKAIKHPEWKNDRINFQPWPYPSATKLIIEEMNKAIVSGDKTFLSKLDPEFVAKDLVDYTFVKAALEKYPAWKKDPSVNPADPYNRQEVLKL
ncbi:MAG: ABC transporter substrate-binding protein [Hyphomicrobium sp.]